MPERCRVNFVQGVEQHPWPHKLGMPFYESRIPARQIGKEISDAITKTGEPAVIAIDTLLSTSYYPNKIGEDQLLLQKESLVDILSQIDVSRTSDTYVIFADFVDEWIQRSHRKERLGNAKNMTRARYAIGLAVEALVLSIARGRMSRRQFIPFGILSVVGGYASTQGLTILGNEVSRKIKTGTDVCLGLNYDPSMVDYLAVRNAASTRKGILRGVTNQVYGDGHYDDDVVARTLELLRDTTVLNQAFSDIVLRAVLGMTRDRMETKEIISNLKKTIRSYCVSVKTRFAGIKEGGYLIFKFDRPDTGMWLHEELIPPVMNEFYANSGDFETALDQYTGRLVDTARLIVDGY